MCAYPYLRHGPSPYFTKNFEYKIDHISKTKNRKNLKISSAFVSEHCAIFRNIHLFWQFGSLFCEDSSIRSHISKTKKRKAVYFIEKKNWSIKKTVIRGTIEHCSTLLEQNTIMATFEGGGGGGSLHVVNWDITHFLNFLYILKKNSVEFFLSPKNSNKIKNAHQLSDRIMVHVGSYSVGSIE